MSKFSAIFPLAGMGTRFLPLTKAVPKEMLPIEGRPSIEYAVKDALEAGSSEMVFIMPGSDESNYKQAIVEYFEYFGEPFESLLDKEKGAPLRELKSFTSDFKIKTCHQEKAFGLGHAVYQARPHVDENENVFVLLPDDIIDSNPSACKRLLDMTEKYDADGAILLQEVPMDQVSRYGVIAGTQLDEKGDVWQVSDMVEKPPRESAPTNLAIVGRYFLPGEIFKEIENTEPGKGGEIQLTDAILSLLSTKKILGVKLEGQRLDTGNILGYELACLWYGLKREKDRPEILSQMEKWLELLKSN